MGRGSAKNLKWSRTSLKLEVPIHKYFCNDVKQGKANDQFTDALPAVNFYEGANRGVVTAGFASFICIPGLLSSRMHVQSGLWVVVEIAKFQVQIHGVNGCRAVYPHSLTS